jgi:hypothetical protein
LVFLLFQSGFHFLTRFSNPCHVIGKIITVLYRVQDKGGDPFFVPRDQFVVLFFSWDVNSLFSKLVMIDREGKAPSSRVGKY